METFEVQEIVVILGVASLMLFIAQRINLPSIVAFLLTGMLVGPSGLQLVDETHIEHLATVGVILLLFSIGMEFSIRKLLSIKRLFFIGGAIQLFSTMLVGFLVAYFIGRPVGEALFLGSLLSLSSTAIVMKTLTERRESDSPHGRFALAIMIFQDVMTIPLLLMVPVFAGQPEIESGQALAFALLKGVAIIAMIYILANYLIPRLMFYVTRTKRREFFLLTILTICFSVALATTYVGLPISLGAFLAGLTVAESEYRHQALGDILPFQETFSSFFFVSVGMLLDLEFVAQHPFLIASVTVGILFMKSLLGAFAGIVLGLPLRIAIIGGLFVSQVGEFSFVLASAGRAYSLGTDFLYQLFWAVSLFTMAISPYLIFYSQRIANFFAKLPVPERLRFGQLIAKQEVPKEKKGHVLILGYGVCGRNLAHSCRLAKIPYVIVEMNSEIVKEEKAKGEQVLFGDASHEVVLRHAGIEHAKVAAIAINDPITTRRTIEAVKRSNSATYTITRTRYLQEIPYLKLMGSDAVVADEFESSVEIFTRVLHKYLIPKGELYKYIHQVRSKGYERMQQITLEDMPTFTDLKFHHENLGIETERVHPSAKIAGVKLSESGLRKIHGVTVLMIKRGDETLLSLDPDTVILPGDLVIIFGDQDSLINVHNLFLPHE